MKQCIATFLMVIVLLTACQTTANNPLTGAVVLPEESVSSDEAISSDEAENTVQTDSLPSTTDFDAEVDNLFGDLALDRRVEVAPANDSVQSVNIWLPETDCGCQVVIFPYLQEMHGIVSLDPDFEEKTLLVEFNADQTTLDAIVARLEEEGEVVEKWEVLAGADNISTSTSSPDEAFIKALHQEIEHNQIIPEFAGLIIPPLYINEPTFSFMENEATILQLNIFGYPDPKGADEIVPALVETSASIADTSKIDLDGIEIVFHRRDEINPMLVFAATAPWQAKQIISTPLTAELRDKHNDFLKITEASLDALEQK